MVAWSLAALAAAESIGDAILAAPPGSEEEMERVAAEAAPRLAVTVVTGGPSRSESVAIALAGARGEVVAVHDAARPLLEPELANRCVERLRHWGCDGVVAAARTVDAMKESDSGGRVLATLERSNLWAVQTPQVFDAEILRRALAGPELDRAYDDAQLVEDAGGDVRIVEAPRHNLKVTSPTDLRIAELLLADRRGGENGAPAPAC
jgi:2-C-methyl-D-erythritol 4-phosphate cytidylyltransferase